ncbi:hypothetical protein J1N35_035433 [Gossypium stocksii]|uniref:Uncharacterized protein n=1 Tax=Gossypium stocksii TaxID=47602 RepID=A0A9D3ZR32_9ROSI|nr:hypothetical protein J1N35_035433 [Gossypium stocksii]
MNIGYDTIGMLIGYIARYMGLTCDEMMIPSLLLSTESTGVQHLLRNIVLYYSDYGMLPGVDVSLRAWHMVPKHVAGWMLAFRLNTWCSGMQIFKG